MEYKKVLSDTYYITDLCQNYYRLDASGQLVVASGKESAGVFNFHEASEKVGTGKKAAFYKIMEADDVDGYQQTIHYEEQKYDEHLDKKASLIAEYDINLIDWKEYLKQFCYFTSSAANYKSELSEQLSNVDLEICDLLHYIELCEIQSDDDEKLIYLLKDARLRRREIKDKIEGLKHFQESIGNNASLIKAQKAVKQLETIDHRTYKPRKLPDLFLDSNKDLGKRDVKHDQKANNEVTDAKGRRVVYMSEVRRNTVFDDRKIDWVKFAKEQVEFYKNAEQHLCNLQIDLDEIDNEIEEILNQIENANCNAVQGYMYFKQLRDLRTLRKEKQKEMRAVEILIDPFNCEAMLEHFEESVDEIEEFMDPADEYISEVG